MNSASGTARILAPLAWVGGMSLGAVRHVGAATGLLGQAILSALRPPFLSPRLLFQQAYQIGVASIPVVVITGLFTGMVLALQSLDAFGRFGAEELVATVVSLAMMRELGPVLTGLMVAGRVGSAMAAELGTMRITEQIDALTTLGTNPVRYLVLPRIIASLLMMPCLVIFANAVGIFGGFVVAVHLFGQNPALYERRAIQYLDSGDLTMSLTKALVFGGVFSVVSCYQGYHVTGGAREVGLAVTRSVVISLMGILAFNYVLTAWLS